MKGGIARHVIANRINNDRIKRKEVELRLPNGARVKMATSGKKNAVFDADRIAKLCEQFGVDPCEVTVLGLSPEHTPSLSEKDRIDIALKLNEYLMPKRRAVDSSVSGDVTMHIELVKDYGD